MRALRLSWDEARVDERVPSYAPDQVGNEFVGALRRPGPDSDAHWAARHRGLIAERDSDRSPADGAANAGFQAPTALDEAQAAQASAQHHLDEARACRTGGSGRADHCSPPGAQRGQQVAEQAALAAEQANRIRHRPSADRCARRGARRTAGCRGELAQASAADRGQTAACALPGNLDEGVGPREPGPGRERNTVARSGMEVAAAYDACSGHGTVR